MQTARLNAFLNHKHKHALLKVIDAVIFVNPYWTNVPFLEQNLKLHIGRMLQKWNN